jgi:hypothetical protein
MTDYLVEWDIDIFDVPTPQDAAEKALRIQRNPDSIATVFRVTDTTTSVQTVVDLSEPETSRRVLPCGHSLRSLTLDDPETMGTFINDTGEVDNR